MSFNFGGGTNAAPAFGTQATTGGSITFGTPAAGGVQQQPSLFGTPAPNTSLSFGGAQPVASAAPNFSFGSIPSGAAPGGGLSFGAPQPTAAPTLGLSFGGASSVAPTFGTPSVSQAAPSINFGGSTFGQPASNVPNTGLNFGSTSLAPTLNFGAPKTTLGGFGAPIVSSGAATGGLSFAAPTATSAAPPAFGLNFGATSSAAPAPLFGSTATTASTGLNFGFGSAPGNPNTTPLGFGLGGLTPAKPSLLPTSTPSLGLGGIPTPALSSLNAIQPLNTGIGGFNTTPSSTLNPTTSTVGTANKPPTEQQPRDQPLPNEILQTVQTFREFIKVQEQHCADIAKLSIKEFREVREEIEKVNASLNSVEKQLQSNRVTAEKLKYDTAKGLQQVEMAQRTHDTPPGLQYDNGAPLQFFIELVDTFEKEMQHIKLQIENTDKYVRNLGTPAPLNSYDLSLGLRRLHDTFVALAGRLQSVHSQVEYQKEQYLTFRRYMLHEDEVLNVFERPTAESDALHIALQSIDVYSKVQSPPHATTTIPPSSISLASVRPQVASGPTPFSGTLHNPSLVQVLAASAAGGAAGTSGQQGAVQGVGQVTTGPVGLPPPYPGTSTFGSPFGASSTTGMGQSSNFFGSSNTGLGSFSLQNTSTNFQLQKPPAGNKRGKP